MYALVTGGGGFLGRYIVEQLLARGDRVRVLARGTYPELSAIGAEVLRGDLREPEPVANACRGVDCVFHTAAIAGIGTRWKPYQCTNEQGTGHVIRACRAHGVGRLVFTSSPSVVFVGRDQCGIDESASYGLAWLDKNGGHYSRSKALAERAVLSANGNQGLQTCALRPHLIWGPRDSHLIPRLIERARSGLLRRVGNGANLVDMTYVENAAAAHLQAADALAAKNALAAGKAYFLSQGEPVECWQWIDDILALAGLPPVRKSVSLPTAWHLGAACEFVYRSFRLPGEPPMTRFLAAQLATSHWFDISAARRDFGYEPQVATKEGMRRLAEWLHRLPP